ncbi:unnamed protein product [[Candida] boidinii]|uniref:Unnamed protein product n=1 Tax=Candida boidinii TaxID=5477 RepID=A0ACB5U952_CANBO|nr:unnamed protein product [[Candida] boidinii]
MYHYKSGYNNYRVNSIVHNEERETKNHGSKISRVPSTSSSSSSSNSVSASVSPPSERVSIDHQEMMSPMVPSIPLPPPPPPPFSNLYFPSFPIPPLPFEPIMFPQMMPTMNPCLNQKSFPVHHNNNINNSNTDSNIDDNENDSHNTGMISQQIQPHPEFFPPHMVDFRQMYPYFMVYNTGIPPPNGLIRSEDYNYIEGENNSHLVNEESGILLENS